MRPIFLLLLFSGFVFAETNLPDACKLLTAEDVQKVVGPGFKLSPFRGTASDNSNCGYVKDKSNVANLLVVDAKTDIGTALKALQEQHTQQNHKVVAIEGAGPGAFYVEYANAITKEPVIAAHIGKATLHGVLEVKIKAKPDTDALQKLAKIVYTRLP